MSISEDANLLGATSLNRRKSIYDENAEELVIKPATELIPDEYEHDNNKDVLVHIFLSGDNDEEVANKMALTLKTIGYDVEKTKNLHFLEKTEDFKAQMATIKSETKNKSALMLIFIGAFEDEGTLLLYDDKTSVQIKSIWNDFSSERCPELKNKPKIFLFCGTKIEKKVQQDGSRHYTAAYDNAYDFPAESDLLIIYKRLENHALMTQSRDNFFINLCHCITENGKTYDIIDLISQAQNGDSEAIPLIISTLTRKFYLTPSPHREDYLLLTENVTNLQNNLKNVVEKVSTLRTASKPKNGEKQKPAVKSSTKSDREQMKSKQTSERVKTTSICSDSARKNDRKPDSEKPRWRF